MDVAKAQELLDGLPVSSSVAREVFHEQVRRYSQDYEREKERLEAFEESRKQAILKMEQPVVGVEDWALIDATAFTKTRLSLSELNVADMNDGQFYVEGLVPVELHRLSYRTDFREPLPFPPDDLTEDEWFVVFAAVSELIPGEPTFCPFARVPDKIVELAETVRMMKPRIAVDLHVCYLKRMTDIAPFKAGRRIVDRQLCRECLTRSLQKAREKTPYNLIVFGSSDRPAFLPTGWESSFWPVADNLEAARQWLGCTLESLLHWNESLHGVEANDIVSVSMASQAHNDAWLLACHVRDNHGIANGPPEAIEDSLSAVIRYLDGLRQAISKPASATPADEKPPSPSLKEIPRGVSLLDAALSVNENDPLAAQEAKKKWGRTDGRPDSIGHDLNQPQTDLYEVGILVEWIFSIEDNLDLNKKKTHKDSLNRIRRPIIEGV